MILPTILFVITIASAQVEYYEKLLTKAYQNASSYQFPINAYEHHGNPPEKHYGRYDFIIIGAGSSGTVVANRLSEITKWKVLLLEAGEYGNNLTDIPASYTPIDFTKYNWAYNSTPQKDACLGMVNKVCLFPRGKGMGGSSLINGLVYARGYKYDYDTWATIAKNKRWAYSRVLEYFKKSEKFTANGYDPNFHGTEGYLQVEHHKPDSPLLDVFFKANEELGYKIVDYNANKVGAGRSQMNTINGQRLDGAKAFIHAAKDRENLEIQTNSYVTKVRIKNKRAVGVQFTQNSRSYYVEATKEVILCAGAIASPQILMLSGIGPRTHLQNLGIELVRELPVGDNLRDNSAFYGLTFSTNYTEPSVSLEQQIEDYLRGVGAFTKIGAEAVGFYESSRTKGTGIPEIELEFVPPKTLNPLSQKFFSMTDQTFEDVWKYNNVSNTFRVNVMVSHARSVGTVRLRTKDPFEYPLINPRFLSDAGNIDISTMYEGIQLVLRLVKTKVFQGVSAKFQSGPIRACRKYKYFSKKYWFCAIRQVTANLYHPSGTCSMGFVVDSELKVLGIEGLRVADASVIPLSLAGHTNAACVMVGEQLGDLIKVAYGNGK